MQRAPGYAGCLRSAPCASSSADRSSSSRGVVSMWIMRGKMILVIVVLAVFAPGGRARAAASGELRLAVVDMQRALNECDAGKKAKDQVKAKFEKAQDALKRQKDDLEKSREDFEKKAIVLKEEERRNLEKDLESRTLDFKRKYEDFQRDLQRT